MHVITRTVPVLGGLFMMAAALLVVHQAPGTGLSAPPTVVVCVDLPRVLNELQQRADAEAELSAMAVDIKAEDEHWQEELNGLKSELEQIARADVAQFDATEEQIALRLLEYQNWRRYKLERLDIEKSLLLRDLYRSVTDAAARLSESQGYDVVINDDSKHGLMVDPKSRVASEDQVKQQMTSKRVLYVRDVVDVTDELIERMNNAYGAGG